MTPKIYIDGEHGTTGLQIITRISAREDLKLLSIPHADRHDVEARRRLLNEADIAILCLPDDAAIEAVAMIDGDTRVIDASTAHRVDPDWTFGFAELDPGHANKIASATRVTNPGCYSTGAIALIHPLTAAGVLPSDALLTINAVSGYSGGGKGMIAQMEDASRNDSISAPHFLYAVGLTHKHVPEITLYGGLDHEPLFSPSVGRFAQGMIVQVPLHLAATNAASRAELHTALETHYAGATNVRVASLAESDAVGRLDATMLAGTDTMDLHVFGNDTHVNLIALLDNLGKGASGACVQALNLMVKGSA
ncbi:N-acetyl-gamma-glutamyl-phosphate reductase [Ahrensia sp. R2A130]|uniref:N-acetyl-gamma-glutamyl-phosphate reductase n=1 Tax=Ahrensia sp. R2A130 TaxID=744979 RepID=UPI0001E08C26|nr:N-acetyl-gamma-glutamyl-phosphate reductase [Ahrensia sp. R2A130]EFL90565.1 N-acetyl-gamma-glutamyl-phosphate reductase [Ahrensia sp. R2A130]